MRQLEYPKVTLLTRCVFGYGLHVEDLRCRSGELISDDKILPGYSGGKKPILFGSSLKSGVVSAL